MRIVTLSSAEAFVVFATAAQALISGGGPSDTNFSCDVEQMRECSGILEGADCQAMLENRKDGTAACHDKPGEPKWCVCRMFVTGGPKAGQPQSWLTEPMCAERAGP
jgi:hypothetical protein